MTLCLWASGRAVGASQTLNISPKCYSESILKTFGIKYLHNRRYTAVSNTTYEIFVEYYGATVDQNYQKNFVGVFNFDNKSFRPYEAKDGNFVNNVSGNLRYVARYFYPVVDIQKNSEVSTSFDHLNSCNGIEEKHHVFSPDSSRVAYSCKPKYSSGVLVEIFELASGKKLGGFKLDIDNTRINHQVEFISSNEVFLRTDILKREFHAQFYRYDIAKNSLKQIYSSEVDGTSQKIGSARLVSADDNKAFLARREGWSNKEVDHLYILDNRVSKNALLLDLPGHVLVAANQRFFVTKKQTHLGSWDYEGLYVFSKETLKLGEKIELTSNYPQSEGEFDVAQPNLLRYFSTNYQLCSVDLKDLVL